eukprot:631828-Amorphochlora_amoeboformis.AAC.1
MGTVEWWLGWLLAHSPQQYRVSRYKPFFEASRSYGKPESPVVTTNHLELRFNEKPDSDGKPGSAGTPGSDGKPGSDGPSTGE